MTTPISPLMIESTSQTTSSSAHNSHSGSAAATVPLTSLSLPQQSTNSATSNPSKSPLKKSNSNSVANTNPNDENSNQHSSNMAVTVNEASNAISFLATPQSSPFNDLKNHHHHGSTTSGILDLPADLQNDPNGSTHLNHHHGHSHSMDKKRMRTTNVTPSEKSVKLEDTPPVGSSSTVTATLEHGIRIDSSHSLSQQVDSSGGPSSSSISPSSSRTAAAARGYSRRGGFSGSSPATNDANRSNSGSGGASSSSFLVDCPQPPQLKNLARAANSTGTSSISLLPRKVSSANGSDSTSIPGSNPMRNSSTVGTSSSSSHNVNEAQTTASSESIAPVKQDSSSMESSTSSTHTPQSPVPPLASSNALQHSHLQQQQQQQHEQDAPNEPLSPMKSKVEPGVLEESRGASLTPPPPANFAQDYGRPELSNLSFDASNVLSWLSPTANTLFSPGPFNKSPRGMVFSPSTPRQHGKLFTDLGVNAGPSPSLEIGPKTKNAFNMICVSPLASSKRATLGVPAANSEKPAPKMPDTPICFKDVFASPKTDYRTGLPLNKSNEIPTLTESSSTGPNELDSKLNHEKDMAERDLMMDEDMSVLLQLAQTTPKAEKGNMRSHRSPRHLKMHFGISSHPGDHPPSSLQLPFIGVKGPSPSRLQRKSPSKSGSTIDHSGEMSVRNGTPQTNQTSTSTKNSLTQYSSDGSQASAPGPMPPVVGRYPAPYPGHPLPPHLSHPPPPHSIYPPPGHMPMHAMPGHPPYPHYPYPPGHPHTYMNYAPPPQVGSKSSPLKKNQKKKESGKRSLTTQIGGNVNKKVKKTTTGRGKGTGSKKKPSQASAMTAALNNPADRQKSAAAISAMNAANGHKNDKAAALASAILRGVTMRPSGKWQAQLYYAGKSRYIGVFDTREKAALAYEIARERLKTDKAPSEQGLTVKETEAHVNAARKAAFAGVNEKDPRIMGK